jgi:signal transduction histidine kinase
MLGAGLSVQLAHADQIPDGQTSIEVTNVHQIRLLAEQVPQAAYAIRLEGDVWWANPAQGQFVLKDDSGAEELEMDLHGETVAAGQKIRLEGNGTITPIGAGFKVGASGPVVDNDGVHNMVEKSGAIFLKAGRNPIRVEWFNGVEKSGLEVEYQGPGLPRQKIPGSALFRNQAGEGNGKSNQVNGLDFKCVEAADELLPDFNLMPALKTGTVDDFDLRVIPQPDHVGVSFTGFLQVPQNGLYTFFATSDDGSRLFVGEPSLELKAIGQAMFPSPQSMFIGQTLRQGKDGQWVEVEGKVTFVSEQPDGLKLELDQGTARVRVEIAGDADLTPALLLNHRIRATGFCQGLHTSYGQEISGVLLVPSSRQITFVEPPATGENAETNSGSLPLLVNAGEIHRLKREEAQRGYPVKIRGVITSVLPEHQAFTLQDSTRGIFVIDYSDSRSELPRIGEFLEVEGITDPGSFAPIVNATKVHNLGIGDIPEPVHPAWDQLMNGSLDAQYVELQGILTSVETNGVILLTPDGRINIDLRAVGLTLQELKRYEDALVRVRGCLFATWDYVTHRVKVGEIRIHGAAITVDQPAPADLFASPRKTASEFLLFDPQASVFQRVKISGQIIHVRDSECFMMDGSNGVRFITKQSTDLQAGDLVEAVGFPELSGASPVLHQAIAHKTGHAALPEARLLNSEDLIRTDLDSTRVRVKAILVNQRDTPTEQLLEMRVGLRSFLARLPGIDENFRDIAVGSQLELTGTYASQSVSPEVASFELLLNSPADIIVLARPPWWTLKKLLFILGALAFILVVTVLWITQLHHKVGQRTAELEIQIRERQSVEQKHTMEQERARIAQDLHDELGSSLTEISMLGVRARSAIAPLETQGNYFEQIANKSREMVMALDEIVWAMNPTHDSLASMVSYFSLYAERFLGLGNITWRLEQPFGLDDHVVDSRQRHQLFLAFKEALTNVVRHSEATEVRLNIRVEHGHIRLTISDNGRGLATGRPTEEMDGITNMRTRMEKLGGRFEATSKTGQGTMVCFDLPLE